MGSRDSGSCPSRVRRTWAAAAGLAPPVEIPTDSRPRRTTAGKRKVLSSRLSATFTGMARFRHSWATVRFSTRSSVAATARETPSSSSGTKGCRSSSAPDSCSSSGTKRGAHTSTRGP